MSEPLTEEDVFSNDIDPMEGIRQIRKAEGVADEDLPESDTSSSVAVAESNPEENLDEFQDKKDDDTDTGNVDDSADLGAEANADENKDTSDSKDDLGDDDNDDTPGESDKQDEPDTTEKLTFKANGQEFEFTQEEVMAQFGTVFGQAMDYTQKMQKIAPYRKMISALEQEGIDQEQLNLAIDALKGDKGALNQILQNHNIESFDLRDTDTNPYQAKDYGQDGQTQDLVAVVSEISGDQEYATTKHIVDVQWDEGSREVLRQNPGFVKGLHNDVKSGKFNEVLPLATKLKVLDGNTKSDIEYYMLAGQQLSQQTQQAAETQQGQQQVDELNKETQAAVDNAEQASSEADLKRAATSTGARADRKGVVDYLDDDDESFNKWYEETMSKV
jgi:hypothetical protein